MSTKEIIASEIDPNFMPEALRDSPYYVGSDESVQTELAVKAEIMELIKEMAPWEAKVAKAYAGGGSIRGIARDMKRSQTEVKTTITKGPVLKLIHYWQHLEVLRDGPNELLRKQMLWRIAVDNEKKDPKESTKALAELNKIAQHKSAQVGGNTVNIVITHATLQKGALDE